MRWIRSNLRGFARLALFALAVQAVVTFGHVHLDGLAGSVPGAQAVAGHAAPPAKSQGNNPHGTADLDCPICALIQLASTSPPAVAPPLPAPPSIISGTILEAFKTTGVEISPTIAFQARGPPTV
jgi:hypothetical protein